MTLRENLIAALTAYVSGSEIGEARLSTVLLGSGARIAKIRNGGDVNTATYERAMLWLSENWPDGCDWPAGVPRPASAPVFEVAP